MEFDPSIFLWTLASFAIVVVVLYYYVFPPIIKFLDEREELQKKYQAQLESDAKEAENLKVNYEQKLVSLQSDIEERLRTLEKELDEHRKKAFDQLDMDKKNALLQLQKELASAKRESLQDMNEKIEEVVFSALTKIVQKKLTIKDHEDIIDDCILEMEKKIAEEL